MTLLRQFHYGTADAWHHRRKCTPFGPNGPLDRMVGASLTTDGRGHFGWLLRTLRQTAGLTQEDLAESSGLSVRAIRDLERGRVRTPQRRTGQILADVLGLDGDDRTRFLAAAAGQATAAGEPSGAHSPTDDRPAADGRSNADDPPSTAPIRPFADPAAGGPGGAEGPTAGTARRIVPAELPAPVTDLTGRDRELTTIGRHAVDIAAGNRAGASVLSVYGPPGIGKTSLAVSAGASVRDLFPDGQLFIDLRGTQPDPVEPTEVLARHLRSLGVDDAHLPTSLTERSALFRTLTDRLGLLIVLDNAGDEAQVRPLLPAGPRCLVLVTSRRPLAGLECAARIGLDLLPAQEGRHLLGAIVGDRVLAEPLETRELVELCGHLPLALRIAGNRLATRPHWPVRQLVDRLRDQRHRLTQLTAGDLGVRAAIDVSYHQLEAEAARVFRFAALIPGPDFGVDLAAVACGQDPTSAAQAVESLVDAGLLAPVGDRYRFHDLIRIYARERLDREPQDRCRSAHDRLVTWLLARTVEAGKALDAEADRATGTPSRRAAARFWLESEADNWLAAVRDGAGLGRFREVVAATRALHWYSDTATHRHPWAEIFGLGVAAARDIGSRSDEMVLLNFHGWALYLCAEHYDDARTVHDQALTLARALGDRREEAWALTYLAAVALRTGRPEQVPGLSRQAAAIFEELGFALGTESALGVLGSGLSALDRCDEALEIHRAVLLSYQRRRAAGAAGTEVGEAGTLMAIAQDLGGLGRLAEAVSTYTEARELFRRCAMPYGEAVAAYRQGLLLRDMRDAKGASVSLGRATMIFADLGAVSWELRAREALSSVERETQPAGPLCPGSL